MDQVRMILTLCLLITVISCKTVKQSSSEKVEARVESREAREENRETKSERITYGDTLKATVPIRSLSRIPQIIRSESKGLDLVIILTDSTVKYRAIAKPVEKENVAETTAIKTKSNQEIKVFSESEQSKKLSSLGLSWWVYLIIILIIAALLLKVFTSFNPMSIWLKIIAGLRR